MKARPYQEESEKQVRYSWSVGNKNVLLVLPTGAGKTFIFSKIASEHRGRTLLIAHRQELIGQISLALARRGVRHSLIAPIKVVKFVVAKHTRELGKSFYVPNAEVTVAGVDTLLRRVDQLDSWLKSVSLWIMDEAHHIVKNNKWGKVVSSMPQANGLGVTATPVRASGEGLGRNNDGVFDDLIVGPSMRHIIEQGYLTDYRVLSIPNDIDLKKVDVSKTTGDYSKNQLRVEVGKSKIVGDVVNHYLRHARGKLGITFVTDIETGSKLAKNYNASGVPAECVSHKTEDSIRSELIERFRRREVLQIVNVDLFGEGFDLPAIEVVSFARPTQSYGLYCQQLGRGLRLLEGKKTALILDHVGNVLRHGLPDLRNTWSLERRGKSKTKKRDPDDIPVRVCVECACVYERIYDVCPFCGKVVTPQGRSGPTEVDGVLEELDMATLRATQNEVNKVHMDESQYEQYLIDTNCPSLGIRRNMQAHRERLQAQNILANITLMWMRNHAGKSDKEIQKRFFWLTGYNMLEVKAMDKKQVKKVAECLLMNL